MARVRPLEAVALHNADALHLLLHELRVEAEARLHLVARWIERTRLAQRVGHGNDHHDRHRRGEQRLHEEQQRDPGNEHDHRLGEPGQRADRIFEHRHVGGRASHQLPHANLIVEAERHPLHMTEQPVTNVVGDECGVLVRLVLAQEGAERTEHAEADEHEHVFAHSLRVVAPDRVVDGVLGHERDCEHDRAVEHGAEKRCAERAAPPPYVMPDKRARGLPAAALLCPRPRGT